MIRKIIVALVLFSLVLSTLETLAPNAYAWKVLSYQTCQDSDSTTGACIDPTSNFTSLDTHVVLHTELDLSDIPSGAKFNTTTEWLDPAGRIHQRSTHVSAGASNPHYRVDWVMNIAGTQAANLPGNWRVNFILDGDVFGHNLLVFTDWFVIASQHPGYVDEAGLSVPFTGNLPNVTSGVCKADQWGNAAVTKMIPWMAPYWGNYSSFYYDHEGYMMLVYGSTGLYACVDVRSEKSVFVNDFLEFDLDTGHNGMPLKHPQSDDVDFLGTVNSTSYSQDVELTKSSSTGSDWTHVVMAASVSQSPNIVCDRNDSSWAAWHSCHVRDGQTQDSNLVWTFFVPLEVLNISLARMVSNYPKATYIGLSVFTIVNRRGAELDALEYPGYSTNATMFSTADLAFLPQATSTTISSIATTSSIGSASSLLTSTTTQPLATSTMAVVHATIKIKEVGLPAWAWTPIALALLGVIAVAVIILRRSTKPPLVNTEKRSSAS